MMFLRIIALVFVGALAGCASIHSSSEKFSDDKYFCSTVRGFQSYLESEHIELSINETIEIDGVEVPELLVPEAQSKLQLEVDDDVFDAPHEPGRRLEDAVSDRAIDVRFCLEKGEERIYFGWADAKYREFVWSETPISLRLATERSCTLSSFPLSTGGLHVQESRIQVPSAHVRSFLGKARQSGERQVPDCPPALTYRARR
ncbi:MAG: hypothetical protein OXG08_11850 [Gammaproteobacteria bacterium]|nr:hypothetical protein [Gammaproteobacteria bacterium]